MKYAQAVLCVGLLCLSCANAHDEKRTAQLPNEIIEINPFIEVSLKVTPRSEENIIVGISYKNQSQTDTFLLDKRLIPFDNKITNDIFGIFAVSTFEVVGYKTPYIGNNPIVTPVLDSSNFIFLLPNSVLTFECDISKAYKFQYLTAKGKTVFAIAPKVFMPAVSTRLKQLHKIDSLDGELKPVFYALVLKESRDIDSMRVIFTIP